MDAATIDLNADGGESFGAWTLGDDAALFEIVTTVSLACGFHAGDPQTMQASVAAARRAGIAVGAHPGLPDLVGFGRRPLVVTPDQAYADVLYQVGALAALARAGGVALHHVKLHGAFSTHVVEDQDGIADAVARAVHAYDPELPLIVTAGSRMEASGAAIGLPLAPEGFPERGYLANGRLAPRGTPGATIHDPELAALRAVRMATEGLVEAVDGSLVRLRPATLCIHGDNPQAVEIAGAVRGALERAGVRVETF